MRARGQMGSRLPCAFGEICTADIGPRRTCFSRLFVPNKCDFAMNQKPAAPAYAIPQQLTGETGRIPPACLETYRSCGLRPRFRVSHKPSTVGRPVQDSAGDVLRLHLDYPPLFSGKESISEDDFSKRCHCLQTPCFQMSLPQAPRHRARRQTSLEADQPPVSFTRIGMVRSPHVISVI